jgi:UDP-N-acetylglucosamine 2-epimerase (non-hydrolysing)
VLSDSGTITEVNFPAQNIREVHERPEGMGDRAVMMAEPRRENVLRCLAVLESQPRGDCRVLHLITDYTKPIVSEKVLRIIHSYTHYVNRTVWSEF